MGDGSWQRARARARGRERRGKREKLGEWGLVGWGLFGPFVLCASAGWSSVGWLSVFGFRLWNDFDLLNITSHSRRAWAHRLGPSRSLM
jgi:hypothetical protein